MELRKKVEEKERNQIIDIDKISRKEVMLNSLIIFALISLYIALSFSRFYKFMSSTPSIEIVKGDVKVFVNGIWIKMRAGINQENLKKLKIKIENGELTLSNNVSIKAEYAEVEISSNSISISKGKAEVNMQNRKIEIKEGEELKVGEIKMRAEEKTPETTQKEKEITEKTEIQEKIKEEKKENLPQISEPYEIQKFNFSLEGNNAKVYAKTKGIKKIFINSVPFQSESGEFNIVFPLKEGKNKIKIVASAPDGKIIPLEEKEVIVDITPPKVEKLKIKWE